MTKQTARRHLLPNPIVSWEASCPSQGVSHPSRKIYVRRLEHRVFGNDRLTMNGDLGHPYFTLRRGTWNFDLFGSLPSPLWPTNLQFGSLDLHLFHYLWKTALLGQRRYRRFFGPNRLLGLRNLENSLLRPPGLNPLLSLTPTFSFWARGPLGLLSYDVKNVHRGSHLQHCVGGDEIGLIVSGSGGGGLSHVQDRRIHRRLLGSRDRRSF